MKHTLKNIFRDKTVIVGIGNTMKSDDGFGPRLVERLKGKIKIPCIDAGPAPENYVGVIAREKPDAVLLADSCHLGLRPGEYQILRQGDLVKSGFTTHDISAGAFIGYLEERTKAKVFLLGVQPKSISFGDDMSRSVKKALDKIAELIIEADNA